MIWNTSNLEQRDHKSVRGNIAYDHLSFVRWSPDKKAFIGFKNKENLICVYKVSKTATGLVGNVTEAFNFPQKDDLDEIVDVKIALNGKFILTCTKDNLLRIWSLKGELLHSLDTHQGETYSAKISTCGRFITTTGFTPDVKIWEVKLTKTEGFDTLKRAFELTGHRASIYDCSMNSDCTRIATVSRDGTWKLYDTAIDIERGQKPTELLCGKYETKDVKARILISPNGLTIVIAVQTNLIFYSAVNGAQMNIITDIYSGDIIDAMFNASSTHLLTVGDRQIRIFLNVAGYMSKIQDLQASLKKATTAGASERIKTQLVEAQSALAAFKKKHEEKLKAAA